MDCVHTCLFVLLWLLFILQKCIILQKYIMSFGSHVYKPWLSAEYSFIFPPPNRDHIKGSFLLWYINDIWQYWHPWLGPSNSEPIWRPCNQNSCWHRQNGSNVFGGCVFLLHQSSIWMPSLIIFPESKTLLTLFSALTLILQWTLISLVQISTEFSCESGTNIYQQESHL